MVTLMTKAILLGYIRVSTDKQTESGAGLEAQRQFLESEAIRRDMRLEIIKETEAMSGRTFTKRIALLEAMSRLDNQEAQALAVAKLDRLSRSVSDFLTILERSRKGKWALVIGDLSLDTSTPLGEAMATISATFAQLERRRIGERTKEGLAIKKAQGVVLGRPRLISPTIRENIKLAHLQGHSLNAIAKGHNQEGILSATGGKWYASTIRTVIKAGS